jgi:Tol biopolymer transport system component
MEIWVANADGSNAAPLTHGPGLAQGTARWSPDGRWVAFDSLDANGQYDIYVIESSGGQPRPITSGPSSKHYPSWSRDGRWVYYQSNRTGRAEVWRTPFAGGPPQQVTTEGGQVPYESTDGRTLFYKKATGELFAKPVAGGPERRLIGGVDVNLFAVTEKGIYSWGPRGADRKYPLLFVDLTSGRSTEVARLAAQPAAGGLTVSPDRQSVLYTASLTTGSDLKLIENFR